MSDDVAPVVPVVKPPSTVAPMMISLIVLGLFAALIAISTYYHDDNALNGYGEVVKNLVIMVVGFWIGSSVSSTRKDATIAAQSAAASKT